MSAHSQATRAVPLAAALATLILGACSGAPPSPPALAYGGQQVDRVSYTFADTTSVSLSVMGQSMQLSQEGVAGYDVTFDPAPTGVAVTLVVRSLAASLNQPMGAPIRVDESMVEGDLAFTLDRVGNTTVERRPRVSDEATQMVSGLSLAHTFFPPLPGRAAQPGDSWVDSLSYGGQEGPGEMSEASVITYTVVGDTAVDGRTLLHIGLEGTTTVANDLELSGMAVSQTSELEVRGLVLWDAQRGVLVEQVRESSGVGQVRVPIAPGPIPIRVRSVQRARLQQEL